jgi:hypothetical protein
MTQQERRGDRHTAQQVREALPMKRAFGIRTAATLLRFHQVPVEVAARVLAAPPEQRRQF